MCMCVCYEHETSNIDQTKKIDNMNNLHESIPRMECFQDRLNMDSGQ